MFGEILRFEISYRLRRPLLYVFAAFFFILPFGAISTDSVMIGGAIGNVARNAPYVIVDMLAMMSAFGLLFLTIFVAPAVNRDHEKNMQELFFSTPLTRPAYVFGRYAGSVAPVILAMVMCCLGIWLASVMPYQDPEFIQTFSLTPYLYGMAVFVVPNMLLMGAVFFSISTLTRRSFYAYVAVIVMMALWGIGASLMSDLDNLGTASIIDPFGIGPFKVATRYWTIAERNTALPALGGMLLANRLIWLGAAAGIMLFTWKRYRMELLAGGSGGKKGRTALRTAAEEDGLLDEAGSSSGYSGTGLPEAARPSAALRVSQLIGLARHETMSVLRSVPFLIITFFGMANLFGSLLANPEGTTSYPLTSSMLKGVEGAFAVLAWLVIIIYGAELVWKDRRAGIDGIVDALPVPDWVRLTSKLAALWATMVVMAAAALVCTVGFQVLGGWFDFQPGLYLKGLFGIILGEWLLLSVLAIFLQVAAGNRYLGTLLMVLCFAALETLPEVGLEHRLYLFAQTPASIWSDMDGYGHFAPAIFWFRTYWTLFSAILAVLASLLWVRGRESGPAVRARLFARRMTPRAGLGLAVLSAAFLLTGAWIYYNTNILNDYVTAGDQRAEKADYERLYGRFADAPQPKIVAADLEVEIYPHRRRAVIGGLLTSVNKTGAPVDSLHLNINSEIDSAGVEVFGGLSKGTVVLDDRRLGYRIYSLDPPLSPGDTLAIALSLVVEEKGFMNGRTNLKLVENGTFFSSDQYVPIIGYDAGGELVSPARRREYGLPPKERVPRVDDQEALMRTFIQDADRISFQATVGTSIDQTAIAPGDLVDEWTAGGRRYFRYRASRPILNFYCFLSGRYEVAREDCGGTAIEVYHHPGHAMNVPRILESARKSLSRYSAVYSPYPYRTLRIVEFPGYREFAQSFSTTIPFSESANFTEDLGDRSTVDMVFFITAHEIAHQWFAHQVTPAQVQGAEMIGESLTQYSALTVMEEDYGPERMKKFLRYELDRYLGGRSKELREEMPLMLVEGQPYIHYNKGGLVLYAMRDYLGAEVMDSVMSRYVRATAFEGPPYTSTPEFMSYLRPAVPDSLAYLVEDMFETITLYDNRLEEASCEMTPDGRYRVRLDYVSRKMRADGKGYETEVGEDDLIEIGVYGEPGPDSGPLGRPLYQRRHRLRGGPGTIEVIVDERPVRAGIDPRNILIDRVPGDNVRGVSQS